MPRRDLITVDGWSEYGLNVFDCVGVGGANNPGDVMVVQARYQSGRKWCDQIVETVVS